MLVTYADRSDGVWAYEVRSAVEQIRDGKPGWVQRLLTGTEKTSIMARITQVALIRGIKGDNTATINWLNPAHTWSLRTYKATETLYYQWEEGRIVTPGLKKK